MTLGCICEASNTVYETPTREAGRTVILGDSSWLPVNKVKTPYGVESVT
jgi:hypothetical protein